MPNPPTIVWFRHTLRLEDNPALVRAAARGPVVPVYVWSPEEEGDWPPGPAAKWWIHLSLRSIDAGLRALGNRLILRRGPTEVALRQVAEETGAESVYWNRRYEPAVTARDGEVAAGLRSSGVGAECFDADLLFDPGEIRTRQGGPFRVFGPFWLACGTLPPPPRPAAAPRRLRAPSPSCHSLGLDELGLELTIERANGMREIWLPGEVGARSLLDRFLDEALDNYPTGRDRPDRSGTSSLSPHLHLGEISPRTVWHAVRDRTKSTAGAAFLRELGWREFAYHQLLHFPEIVGRPLRPAFRSFPWRHDPKTLRAWQHGRTGFPFVDAGMRQLWSTGWLHNRVRMVVASFLVKHLLLSWESGARWFWDTLVDADLANNSLNWQWSAGCGIESSPYVRVFNPVSQGEKFDPYGNYVRSWVPELTGLSRRWIHRPWEAAESELQAAGVRLGVNYPRPVVGLDRGRRRALEAYRSLRLGDGGPG